MAGNVPLKAGEVKARVLQGTYPFFSFKMDDRIFQVSLINWNVWLPKCCFSHRFGVCCVFLVTDAATSVSQNCTYIQNPGYPSPLTTTTSLSYTVNKCSPSMNTYNSVCDVVLRRVISNCSRFVKVCAHWGKWNKTRTSVSLLITFAWNGKC